MAFTASRQIPKSAEARLRTTVLATLGRYDLYVTGACVGGDQEIASIIAECSPTTKQHILVPRDRTRVDPVWLAEMRLLPQVRVLEMPRGTTYRDRNYALLGEGFTFAVSPHLLVGFPLHPESHPESQRSGTWMTIRMARANGTPAVWQPLAAPVPA